MPGITNPAEPFFKDGIWGWNGTAWKKLPMVWGFSEGYGEIETTDDSNLGTHDLTFSTVATDEVWTIQAFVMRNITNICDMQFRVDYPGVGVMIIDYAGAVPIGDCVVCVATPFVVPGDGKLIARFLDCTALDNLRSYAIGYKMKIAE